MLFPRIGRDKMADAKVQQKLGATTTDTIEDQVASLTPGDRFRYNGKQPPTMTHRTESAPTDIIVCHGPRMGVHRLAFVGPSDSRNLVEIGDSLLDIQGSVESFEVLMEKPAEDSTRLQLARQRGDVPSP